MNFDPKTSNIHIITNNHTFFKKFLYSNSTKTSITFDIDNNNHSL